MTNTLNGVIYISQRAQELRAERCHELVADTSLKDVSNVSFIDPVTDTPPNNKPNGSFNNTNNHSPAEELEDVIVEESSDDADDSPYDEWVDVIEEGNDIYNKANAVFGADNADAASEGSALDNNPVHPNGGNLFTDNNAKIAQQITDPFNLSNFCKYDI